MIAEQIMRHDQVIQAVFPRQGETGTPFFYTIGNAPWGLPELLLIGNLRPETAMLLLNPLGERMRSEGKPLSEGLLDIGWNYPVKVRKTGPAARERYTVQAGVSLGHEDYEVKQIMICDREGRFPGDIGCELEVDRP